MKCIQAILLALPIALAAQAQTGAADRVKMEATRAELAKLQTDLSDSDPLIRLAAIKTVVESQDAVKIDLALKIALGSSDAAVRSVALRAYIANVKELHFTVSSPAGIQKRIELALNGEPAELDELVKQYPYLSLTGMQPGFGLAVKNYDMTKTTGTATANGNASSFTVVGDRVSGWGEYVFRSGTPCGYEFQLQKAPKDEPLVLKGSLQCESTGLGANHVTFPRLSITAPMF